MLDLKGFIDYDQFCKFDMAQASSQAYSVWRQRKDVAVFSENVEAWRRTDNLFHEPLPGEISNWLSRYGYSVGEADLPEAERLQYHQDYSFSALEPLNLAQSGQIQALEGALTRQAEHINVAEEDWAARGDLIGQLAKTIEDQSRQIEEQSGRIKELLAQVAAGADRSAQLEQEVADARLLIEKQEGELHEFRSSWCGTLIKAVGKFRSQ
ncbi:hypothetical protein FQZ97_764480 [compost metagenome]